MHEVDEIRTMLATRQQELLARIDDAALRSGRVGSDITMLAVSKTVSAEVVALAYEVGYRSFGENRPQELARKVAAIKSRSDMSDIRFDMIGNLQTNKINQVLSANPSLIHSVSSIHLAEAISSRAQRNAMVVNVLIEVNISGEITKAGFTPSDALQSAELLASLEGIHPLGVMTMAPAHDLDAARRTFSDLREFSHSLSARCGLELPIMSCGMSDDFEVAIEEGSNLVRLGRIIFDPTYQTA